MDPEKVAGYNVYRKLVGGADSLLTPVPITDTFFVDSTVVQDEVYSYSVASVDAGDNEGRKSEGIGVEVVSAFALVDSIGIEILQGYQRIDIAKNGDIYILDIVESSGQWSINIFDTSYNIKNSVSFNDTILFRPNSFTVDSLFDVYTFSRDGVFKFDSNISIVDTITDWAESGNKHIKINDGYIYLANDELRKYSTAGDSIISVDEAPSFRAEGEIEIIDNQLYITGKNNIVRIYDLDLNLIEEFELDFLHDEFTSLICYNQQKLYIYGNHYDPRTYSLIIYDNQKNYQGRLFFDNAIYDLEIVNSTLIVGSNDKILVYRKK
jgi:hypothetical protein